MTVHVDEIHTDVVPSGGGAEPSSQASEQKHLGAALEKWRESCADAGRLTARTCAQGFDD